MKALPFWTAVGLVVALTVLSGVLQGRMRNRWGPAAGVLQAVERLGEFPTQFGEWRMQSSDQLDKVSKNMLECDGYFARTYVHQGTGDTVSVTVLLGPAGTIAVHIPEICYGSKNYSSRSERRRVAIAGQTRVKDEFWMIDFRRDNLRGDTVRSYYAWSTGRGWMAPDEPRYAFAGQPYLYKVQLSGLTPTEGEHEMDSSCHRFLQDFVPIASKYLIDPAPQAD